MNNIENKTNQDPLKKRYFYKLFSGLGGYAIGLITAGIIPRGLGPKNFGDFNFLSSFFSQIVNFLDMGSSTAFYTKLSQRQKEPTLISFYSYFVIVVAVLLLVFVAFVRLFSFHTKLWPDQDLSFVYLAVFWAVLNWVITILNQVTDAFGLTVSAETTKIYQKILSVFMILVLYYYKRITLLNFFLYQYILFIFLFVVFNYFIVHNGYLSGKAWKLTITAIKKYIREFISYCHPLLTYSVIGLIVGLFDRWILQFYGGSIQQGFYGFSYQIGAMCFIFTGSMTVLLTREFSIAFNAKNLEQMKTLFRRYIPLLYSITAYFSCFAALQANKLIYIFGGNKYQSAILPVTIMVFYPIHQTYGQLSNAVFMATGQTKLYSKIGIIFTLIGLPITYFLIAPHGKMGLQAGATGLAIKMVFTQFIAVNTYLYFNAKFLKFSYWRYLGHQIVSIACLLLIAFVATFAIDRVLFLGKILNFITAGFIYTLIVAALIFWFPICFGLKKQDIQSFIYKIKEYRKT